VPPPPCLATPHQPELWLAVTAAAGADLGRLAGHLPGELLPGVRTTVDQPTLTATLRIIIIITTTTIRRQPQNQSPAVVAEHATQCR
jgi:hypothetical protein